MVKAMMIVNTLKIIVTMTREMVVILVTIFYNDDDDGDRCDYDGDGDGVCYPKDDDHGGKITVIVAMMPILLKM